MCLGYGQGEGSGADQSMQMLWKKRPIGPHLMCTYTCQFLTGTQLPHTLHSTNIFAQVPTALYSTSVELGLLFWLQSTETFLLSREAEGAAE